MTKTKAIVAAVITGVIGYGVGMSHCAIDTLNSFDKDREKSMNAMDECVNRWRDVKSDFKETFKRK